MSPTLHYCAGPVSQVLRLPSSPLPLPLSCPFPSPFPFPFPFHSFAKFQDLRNRPVGEKSALGAPTQSWVFSGINKSPYACGFRWWVGFLSPALRYCAGPVLQVLKLPHSHPPPLLLPIPFPFPFPSPFPKVSRRAKPARWKNARCVPTQSWIFRGINPPTLMGSDGGWVF